MFIWTNTPGNTKCNVLFVRSGHSIAICTPQSVNSWDGDSDRTVAIVTGNIKTFYIFYNPYTIPTCVCLDCELNSLNLRRRQLWCFGSSTHVYTSSSMLLEEKESRQWISTHK